MRTEVESGEENGIGAYDIVRVAVGLLLLSAAGAKASALADSATTAAGLLASQLPTVCLVEGELALAILLLSGRFRKAAWGVTVCCFSIYVVVAGYKALTGAESCGCFGRMQVDPRVMAVVDLGVLVLLMWIRPDRSPAVRVWGLPGVHRAISPVAAPVLIAVVVILHARLLYSQKLFGSPELVVAMSPTYACEAREGEAVMASFPIRNMSGEPVKLLGVSTSCGCTTAQDAYPVELGAGASREVHLRVVVGKANGGGEFTRSAALIVNRGAFPLLTVSAKVAR